MSKDLEEAAAAVADRRRELAKLDEEIVAENHAIAIATQEIAQNVFAASLGNEHAIAKKQKAQSRQSAAEARKADIYNRRWPAAKLALDQAEAAQRRAQYAANAPQREALKRECVKAAARFDAAMAMAASAYADLERLRSELQNDQVQSGMAWFDEARRQMCAALPEFIKSLMPAYQGIRSIPMAQSEATRLGLLPPEQEAPKAA